MDQEVTRIEKITRILVRYLWLSIIPQWIDHSVPILKASESGALLKKDGLLWTGVMSCQIEPSMVLPPQPFPPSGAVAAALARRTSLRVRGNSQLDLQIFEGGDVEAELIADLHHLPLGGMGLVSPRDHSAAGRWSGLGLTPGLRSSGPSMRQMPSSACSGELQRYSSASVELQNERENALRFALHLTNPGMNGQRCASEAAVLQWRV